MKQYIVDAFTDKLFSGNQAAVCVMDQWIPDELMQNIAKENNLSETAFTVKENDGYRLRWFTPAGEIDFCGHATMGTSFVLLNYYLPEANEITFYTQVGKLTVFRRGDTIELDFPTYQCHPIEITVLMKEAIGTEILEAYRDRDLLFVLRDEDAVKNLTPNQEIMAKLDGVCIAVTAKSANANCGYDCVSRVFAPELSIPEDPVTGSTHCMIVPYWAEKLGKAEITAYQASERGGTLYAKLDGDRVKIAGKAVLFSVAELNI